MTDNQTMKLSSIEAGTECAVTGVSNEHMTLSMNPLNIVRVLYHLEIGMSLCQIGDFETMVLPSDVGVCCFKKGLKLQSRWNEDVWYVYKGDISDSRVWDIRFINTHQTADHPNWGKIGDDENV